MRARLSGILSFILAFFKKKIIKFTILKNSRISHFCHSGEPWIKYRAGFDPVSGMTVRRFFSSLLILQFEASLKE
ncbi:MAG: hypothetical protein DRG87_07675 [Deltaproteobacteria bacterium]|nr:MAG: hypothetical protein DRG87_07675 [Deltaproteobacteria bacterium]